VEEQAVNTPEDRQNAIDVMTEALVQGGMDENEAESLATSSVDEAIKRQES
jgi:hypothetical protein